MKREELQNIMQSVRCWLTSSHYKRWRRRALAGVVTVAVLGGVGVGSAHYYEGQQKAKLAAARSEMIRSDAEAHHVTLLDETAIRSIMAKAVNVDEEQLAFERVRLAQFKPDKEGHNMKHRNDTKHDEEGKRRTMKDGDYKDRDHRDRDYKNRDHKGDHSWDVAPIPDGLRGHYADMTPVHNGEGAMPPVQADGHVDSNNTMPSVGKKAAATSSSAVTQGTPSSKAMTKDMTKIDGYIHPVYKVRAAHDGVVYKLVIDAVDGHVIAKNVDSASPFDVL